jgi:hypothetical protein
MKSNKTIALVLLALTVLARCIPLHTLHLPDPTLAALFVLGALGIRAPHLALVLLTLLSVDGLKIALGSSSACLSPGYPLLFVSYGVMAWLGRKGQERALALQLVVLVAATTLSYAISSGGYYLLSGRFAEPSLHGFAERLALYLPNALITTFAYASLALSVGRIGPLNQRHARML